MCQLTISDVFVTSTESSIKLMWESPSSRNTVKYEVVYDFGDQGKILTTEKMFELLHLPPKTRVEFRITPILGAMKGNEKVVVAITSEL